MNKKLADEVMTELIRRALADETLPYAGSMVAYLAAVFRRNAPRAGDCIRVTPEHDDAITASFREVTGQKELPG